MKDLMSAAFEGMWADEKRHKKPMYPKVASASKGSMFVQDVKPINYRPQVQRGLTQAQQYALIKKRQMATAKTNKAIANVAKSFFKGGVGAVKRTTPVISKAVKSTETYQKYDLKREKDALWKKYKAEKAAEARRAEIDAYKKKLFGKSKN